MLTSGRGTLPRTERRDSARKTVAVACLAATTAPASCVSAIVGQDTRDPVQYLQSDAAARAYARGFDDHFREASPADAAGGRVQVDYVKEVTAIGEDQQAALRYGPRGSCVLAAERSPLAAAGARVYSAFIEPETPDEQAAWRTAMPAWPRRCLAQAPALGVRAVARRDGERASRPSAPRRVAAQWPSAAGNSARRIGARRSHDAPVVYLDDPYRRLESASSVRELGLLRIFRKAAAHPTQREYRFALWPDGEAGRATTRT